ncbi:MAG TPA: ATP-binding cassette domain-containing protein [Burkholderiales bacterium]|nr:ATP-binding cassette domain-containing protein [Burkholderiales bacterium]
MKPPNGAEPAQPVVRVERLTVGYGDRVLLRDVSFEVWRGEVFAVLGGSGSGKSTLLKHMIGLHRPSCGRVLIEGEDIVAAQGARRAGILRKIGVMYQQGALFGSMTLLENVRLPLEVHTPLDDRAIDLVARMKLALVQLSGAEERFPAELSGGMRKRAAIARALALDPSILFLDEPSAGLDPVLSAELDRLVLRLARELEVTVVLVTHELDSVFRIVQRAVMLDHKAGGIVAQGDPRALRHSDDPAVRRFFEAQPALA